MRSVFCLLVFFSEIMKAVAQETEYFDMSAPSKDISYSVFSHVEFADTRLNQDYIGIKQKGDGNHLVPIWLHASLGSEMKTLIDSVIKNVPQQPQTILLNFRSFFIDQYTGRFEFHVECYVKWEDGYWPVYRLDSVYKMEPKQITKKVNKIVGDFISTIVHLDLSKNQKRKAVSLDYIRNIDMNEKKALPVFTLRNAQRGVYYTYEEFKNNSPRVTIFNLVKGRDELKSVFRLPVGSQLPEKIPRDSLYAVSDGDNTWLAAPHEYARLNKRGLDFYFMATTYENNKVEEVSLSYLFFGIPGALVTAIPRKALYEFRVNHINGKYILLRRAPDR